ncbi:S41 family peptidase [Halobacteriovorax sp. GB3]|uniref:S41 family peptidase n=1 Tax=Halobacteriovorax sp. GB3 TaxID=2719615 RepID=UPI002360D363|nr:S41 family peptidase [Halobacteriovorax sp. GB3]MDD0854314.1 S41 family peptidase [Halobacteriovorax sp. GB3]
MNSIKDEELAIEKCLNSSDASISRDIDLLIYTLREGYAGSIGLDPSEFKELLNQVNLLREEQDNEVLYSSLKEIFTNIKDNHLKIWKNYAERSIGSVSPKLYEVGRNIADEEEVVVRRIEDGNYNLIGLSHFPMPNSELWKSFLIDIESNLINSEFTIIDFRGNGGGNDYYGYKMAELFYGQDFCHPINSQLVLNTALVKLVQSNTFYKRNEEYFNKFRFEFNNFNTSLGRELRHSSGTDVTKVGRNCYNKPIYILIDNDCKSSGESTALCFEDHPQIHYVGQATNGCIEFGNVGIIVLPYSKLCIQISTHKNIFRDNRKFEKVGIQPNIKCEPGQDALDIAIQDYRNKKAFS